MANEVNHTPGPWNILWSIDGYHRIMGADMDLDLVAKVLGHAPTDGDMEAEAIANALLVAAAPEMLELIRDIASYECCCNKQSGRCWQCRSRLLATKATAGK